MSVAAAAQVPDNRRILLLSASALAIAITIALALKASTKMNDFEVYWRTANRALAGEPLYQPADGHWLFKYLPAFAVVAMPIALLPLQVAKGLWFVGSVASLAVVIGGSQALLPELRKPRWVLVLATTVVMGKFYGHELVLGQTNLLLAAAITGALLALKRQQEFLAGALVVVAIILKPYSLIFLPWLLARRHRGSLASASIGIAVALAAPVARYGFASTMRLHQDWWRTVVGSTEPNLFNPDNVSWLAMYSRWLQPGTVAAALTVATAIVACGAVTYVYFARERIRFPELLEASLLLILMPLISPQGWDYTLLVATTAVMCLINYEDRLPPPLRVAAVAAMAVVGLSIYDVMGRTMYGTFMNHSGITLCFFIIIAALVELRRRQVV